MYSLDQFALMFADKIRMEAYSAAIARSVRPGDAVVDLGCGPGVFALLACKSGARRVYAIDMDGVVDFGRQLASANGFGDRILFLRGDSRQVHLPERVNVLVSDVRGVLPLHSNAIDTIEDARDRFLEKDGCLLPSRDTLFAAIVELPEHYGQLTRAWSAVPELDLSSGLPLVLNTIYRHHIKPQQVLSSSRPWHVLDYTKGAKIPAQARLELPITRTTVAHGIGIWFETQLAGDIGYSTEPGSLETVYGHLFLPWLEPVSLREGEICSVDLRAHLVGTDYIWRWETDIPPSAERQQVRFVQSSFYGSLFPPSVLRKRAMGFVPVLNETGQAERWIFQAIGPLKILPRKLRGSFLTFSGARKMLLIKLPKLPRNFRAENFSALYRVHYIWFGEDVCSQHRNMHPTSWRVIGPYCWRHAPIRATLRKFLPWPLKSAIRSRSFGSRTNTA